jgi:hypothetical protein
MLTLIGARRPIAFLGLFLCHLLGPKHAMTQAEPLRAEERYLLSLLVRDTSTVTVAYLPHRFAFGIKPRFTQQHLILVKDRKKTYFLVNGTYRVFVPDPADPLSRLIRIDSTHFEGDNFLMMAFTRKDTLFQFGGYGFWRIKDHFSFYDPSTHEWSFWNNGMAHQGAISLYQYEASGDRFYFAGKMPHDEHGNIKNIVKDSMYVYDFKNRSWENIGQLSPQIWKDHAYLKTGRSWLTPAGICLFDNEKLRLVDLPGNRVLHTRKSFDSTLNLIFRGQYAERVNYFPIQLGDTVYFFSNTGNEPDVVRYRFDLADFDRSVNEQVYKSSQATEPSVGFFSKVLLAGIPLVTLILYFFRKELFRRKLPGTSSQPVTGTLAGEKIPESLSSGQSKISLFMSLLSHMEKDLVKEMAVVTSNNEMMEINQINRLLGVSKKDLSLQKNRRSVAISHINSVFQSIMHTEDNLIIREKDDFDKRSFRYSLNSNYVTMIAEHVQA